MSATKILWGQILAVFALTLDRGFAGADFVDTTANDFKALLDRAAVGGGAFGLGKYDHTRPRIYAGRIG